MAPARRAWPRSYERAADFTYQVTNAVCHRMNYCGERDEGCALDLSDRRFDALACDGAPADLPSWLHTATALRECEAAYRCTN